MRSSPPAPCRTGCARSRTTSRFRRSLVLCVGCCSTGQMLRPSCRRLPGVLACWSCSSDFRPWPMAVARLDEPMREVRRGWMMNRTKALVLALFAVYWVFVVVLLATARDVYDSLLAQAVKLSGDPRLAEI